MTHFVRTRHISTSLEKFSHFKFISETLFVNTYPSLSI